MATPQRLSIADLIALTQARDVDSGDDFFEQVRFLERQAHLLAAEPRARLGADGPPAAEPVQFRATQEPVFAARAIEHIGATATGQITVDVALFGLTGPSGVLPAPYGALVRSRLRQRDRALADFLDLFNHRLIALYYRAWSKYRVAAERELTGSDTDPFTRALRALTGDTAAAPAFARLFYGGHFSRARRSAGDLARMTADFLGVPTAVDGFIGQWLPIAMRDRLQLGSRGSGTNNHLGSGVVAGRRIWDMQSRFALRLGPLSEAEFERLLPGTPRFAALAQLLHDFAPPHLDIQLHYLVRGRAQTCLDGRSRLGRNVWLRSRGDALRRARIQLRRAPST